MVQVWDRLWSMVHSRTVVQNDSSGWWSNSEAPPEVGPAETFGVFPNIHRFQNQ